MPTKTNWAEAVQPLIKKYKNKRHPLEYNNTYQLLVMVVLSAQDSDKNINNLAPAFFNAYPDMASLARTNYDDLIHHISKVRNFGNKARWLIEAAQKIKEDKNIPLTMDALTALPGIGRKSANVIMRETGTKAVGVIVDLHVLRVAPRLGIATGTDPKKIEKQIMEVIPGKDWGQIGMAFSFLGRETCRPTNPKHDECVLSSVCEYCKEHKGAGVKPVAKVKAKEKKPVVVKKKAVVKPKAKKVTVTKKKATKTKAVAKRKPKK